MKGIGNCGTLAGKYIIIKIKIIMILKIKN